MCKYNNPYYWEGILLKKKDLWQNYFADKQSAEDAIFINTVVIDYERAIVDNNWACYPDTKALLGFIQYIYLPLAFFYTINVTNRELYIPIFSHQEMITYIRESKSDYGSVMETSLDELNTYWELDNASCLQRIREFSSTFNAFWNQENSILHLGIFGSTFEIADHLIHKNDMIQVLEEDIGLSTRQFMTMCENFYTNQFTKRAFVKLLNHDIGCIV